MHFRKKRIPSIASLKNPAVGFCVILFVLNGSFCATAQSNNDNRWHLGFLAGINTTNLIGSKSGGFQKLGITAGIIVHKPLTERGAFETGLNFFQKGVRTPANPEAGKFESYRLSLNYLDLPVLYIFKLAQFEIETGPSFGLLLSQKEEISQGRNPDTRPFNTFELAANAGLRWHPADNFLLGLRYHLAVLPSQSAAPAGVSTLRGLHNHGFVIWGTFLI